MSTVEKYYNLFVKADQALHCETINSTAHLAMKENQGKGVKYLMIQINNIVTYLSLDTLTI